MFNLLRHVPIGQLFSHDFVFVTKSVCTIPELKDTARMLFIKLTPTTGEWLHRCFDVNIDRAAIIKDGKGVLSAFKLVIAVADTPEECMLRLDQRVRALSALHTKMGWRPHLFLKAEHASSCSTKVLDGEREARNGNG